MSELQLRAISLSFGSGASRMMALRGVNLTLYGGVFNVLTGPSGSGKTSLLSIVGLLITPDVGTVLVDGNDLGAMPPTQRTRFRRASIGYIFQSFRLMRTLSAFDNVMLSLEVRRSVQREARAHEALGVVGLESKKGLLPSELSGGEQQRVAVARAIAHRPRIVLADEPTANLDSKNGLQVAQLLTQIAKDPQRVVVVVSHDPRVLPFAQRTVRVEDGRVVGDDQ